MNTLKSRAYVHPPTSILALGKLAGMSGAISLRALMGLLGPAEYRPRPVYVLGHNTNTPEKVFNALAVGANGLEIDVTPYGSRPTELCVAHRGTTGNDYGDDDDPPLVAFLQFLRQRADALPSQFALLMFDVKPHAATPAAGKQILEAARRHLIDEANPINIIISTASVDGRGLFDLIAPMLRPREGIMIDEEDSPTSIESLFKETLGLRGQGYGNGSSLFSDTASEYRTAVGDACWIRAKRDGFHFVYAWTVNAATNQLEYLRIGVDGMVTDNCGQLIDLINSSITPTRLATRSDNPFMPANAAYALTVVTGAEGTDSDITFTLHGTAGSTSMTVDTNWTDRMESGQTNFIVLQSPDLGELKSIAVQSDRSGLYPNWFLESITVDSFRYGVHRRATFHRTITSTAVVSAPLV